MWSKKAADKVSYQRLARLYRVTNHRLLIITPASKLTRAEAVAHDVSQMQTFHLTGY